MLLEMMKEVVGDGEGGPAGPLYIGTASSDAIRLQPIFLKPTLFFVVVEAQLKRCLNNKL